MLHVLYGLFTVISSGFFAGGISVLPITHQIGHLEEPFWDGRSNILYFINQIKGEIYAYHFFPRTLYKISVNGNASAVIPEKNVPNTLITGVDRDIVCIKWDGKNKFYNVTKLTTTSQDFPDSSLNDGKADSKGRLWIGTKGRLINLNPVPNQGAVYKITKENLNNPEVVIAPLTTSNGLAWNKANDKFYFIDSINYKVSAYDFNSKEGTVSKSNKTVFDVNIVSTNPKVYADGMTIDTEDNLYVALIRSGKVVKVNPATGKVLLEIEFPCTGVTSVAWGGPHLDILFVTTSDLFGTSPGDKFQGSLFAVTGLGARGFPAYLADILPSN